MRGTPPRTFWAKSDAARSRLVRRVCDRLEQTYDRPRLGNPRRPLDDLFYIIISNRTAPGKSRAVYQALRRRYPRWSALAEARVAEIGRVLRPAGLARRKAAQVRGIARKLVADFGRVTLAPVTRLSDEEALHYLRSLPGVSTKVAYCVMMYTMGREVLPVDVHVHRVCTRLGWVDAPTADAAHHQLTLLVPPELRFIAHVGCVVLGREVCRPRAPDHGVCPVRDLCDRYRTEASRATVE